MEVGRLSTSTIAGRGCGLDPRAVRRFSPDSTDFGRVRLVCPVSLLNQKELTLKNANYNILIIKHDCYFNGEIIQWSLRMTDTLETWFCPLYRDVCFSESD